MATITVADLATALDTDARSTRKFLRSITPKDAQPGKGSRWAIEKKDLRSLKSQFNKYTAAQDEARKAREAAAAEVREVEDEEPTDEELEVIDSE